MKASKLLATAFLLLATTSCGEPTINSIYGEYLFTQGKFEIRLKIEEKMLSYEYEDVKKSEEYTISYQEHTNCILIKSTPFGYEYAFYNQYAKEKKILATIFMYFTPIKFRVPFLEFVRV